MGKYKKDILNVKINKEAAEREEQEILKKKHNIQDEDVVVVEKSNMVKFTVNTFIRLVKLIATIMIIILATLGAMSLIYPEPRADMVEIVYNIFTSVRATFS